MFGYLLRRVVAAVVVALVLMLVHQVARAGEGVYSYDQYVTGTGTRPSCAGGGVLAGGVGGTRAEACAAFAAGYTSAWSCYWAGPSVGTVAGDGSCNFTNWAGTGNVAIAHSCTGGATLVNGVCTGGNQEAICAAQQGQDASASGWYNFGSSRSWSLTSCALSCGMSFYGGTPTPFVISGKTMYYGFGKFVWTGSTCSVTTPTPADAGTSPPAQSCGANQDGGTVNGVWICVDRLSGKPVDPNDANGDGYPDSCEPGTVTNSDGTTTTISWNASTNMCSTVTKDSGGNTTDTCTGIGPDACKTTCGGAGLTTVGAGCDEQINGGAGGGGNTPSPEFCISHPTDPACAGGGSDWCKDHPDAMMCQTNTISASCSSAGASVTCNGDPVMCQMAREQATRDCQLFDQTTTQSQLGAAVAAGQDPIGSTLPSASNPSNVTLGTSSIDQTEIFSGGCIAPWSFTVVGKTVNIDTTTFCDWAGKFGIVAQMAALVAAAFIIGGAL